jgi:uncharacterized protein
MSCRGNIMKLEKGKIERIKEFALNFYKGLDFAHNVEHMKKTVAIAEFIAEKEKADVEIVRLGAMVHQFHDNISELKEFLESLNLDSEIKKKLIECTEFRPHIEPKKDSSIEAKVVYDADALQVLGPYGIMREITCNIKSRNQSLEEAVKNARKIEKLFYDSLQTETAKKMIEPPHKIMKEFWKIYDKWIDNKF